MEKQKIGAEAVIIQRGRVMVKRRVRKGYRAAELDEKIRKQRTALEARLLSKASAAGVNCPAIISTGDYEIVFERIGGPLVKDLIEKGNVTEEVFESIGRAVAKLHSADIIHGDLTTSNMIWNGERLYLVDFGLGKASSKTEDKAMDLYLLYQVLLASGKNGIAGWKSIIKAYEQNYSHAAHTIDRLEKIGKRRRYR